jgi:hypothetical protein
MSDRWKDELKKLRGVEPPDGLWDRAQQPPSADRLPPRRERIVAGVVAMSVFVAAGAFAFQALRPGGGSTVGTVDTKTTVAVEFFAIANEETPRARMTFGGKSVKGVGTSFCWSFEGGGGCADTTGPDFRDAQYLQIPRGTRLVITGNVEEVVGSLQRGTLMPFEIVKGLGVIDRGIDLDFVPDRYVLELSGEWPDVSRTFYFPIEIVENGAGPSTGVHPIPDVAQVVCDVDGARVLTPVVAAQSDGVHLLIDNRSGATSYELLTGEHGTGVGGPLKRNGETQSGGISIEPGEVKVACLPATSDTYLGQFTASFKIEDTNGLWTPSEPACDGRTSEFSTGLVYSVPTKDQILGSLDGVLESDEVVKPGYPETEWKVINLVVRRDGAIVAHVWVAGGLHLDACEGSGIVIAPAADAPPPDCATADQIAFEHTGGVDEPAGEAFIRVNTIGILPSDVLTHTSPASGPTGDDGLWTVARDGSVIAWVDYPDLNGVACTGSGVGGVA